MQLSFHLSPLPTYKKCKAQNTGAEKHSFRQAHSRELLFARSLKGFNTEREFSPALENCWASFQTPTVVGKKIQLSGAFYAPDTIMLVASYYMLSTDFYPMLLRLTTWECAGQDPSQFFGLSSDGRRALAIGPWLLSSGVQLESTSPSPVLIARNILRLLSPERGLTFAASL